VNSSLHGDGDKRIGAIGKQVLSRTHITR